MPTTTTETKYLAVTAASRDEDLHWTDGINADQPTYGEVVLLKVTTTERRADGDVGRLLDSDKTEEVVARLDARTANALAASLTQAAINSLTPVAPKDLRG